MMVIIENIVVRLQLDGGSVSTETSFSHQLLQQPRFSFHLRQFISKFPIPRAQLFQLVLDLIHLSFFLLPVPECCSPVLCFLPLFLLHRIGTTGSYQRFGSLILSPHGRFIWRITAWRIVKRTWNPFRVSVIGGGCGSCRGQR